MGKKKKTKDQKDYIKKKPQLNEEKKVEETKKDLPKQTSESKNRLIILGSSLGIFVIIVALFATIYIVTELNNDPVETDVVVVKKRSPDEIKLEDMINDLEQDFNSMDANEDFAEFEDSEFAIEGDEEELESAIDDIDQMMSDLEQLEGGLDDFNEDDF